VQPRGPYRLLGWSVGGVIAHAIAVALQRDGEEVDLLAVLDAYPSDQWRELAEPTESEALVALLNIAGIGAPAGDEPLRRDAVVEALRAEGSALASLEDRTLSALVDIVVNNARLMREHVHESFAGDLLHVRAAAPRSETWLSAGGWQRHVGGRLEILDVPCTHVEIVRPDAIAQIVPALVSRLAGRPAQAARVLDGSPA
jgi:enterobactin synthetase component F